MTCLSLLLSMSEVTRPRFVSGQVRGDLSPSYSPAWSGGFVLVPVLAEREPCPTSSLWSQSSGTLPSAPPHPPPRTSGSNFPRPRDSGERGSWSRKGIFASSGSKEPHTGLAFEIQEAGCVLFFLLALPVAETDLLRNPQPCLGKVRFEFVPPEGSGGGFYINGSATSETFVFNEVNV